MTEQTAETRADPLEELRERLREAIGTTEAGVGLPHWHHASGGTTAFPAENDKAGVFVERQAVLDIIDAVIALGPTEEELKAELDAALDAEISEEDACQTDTERVQQFTAYHGIPLPEGLHICSNIYDSRSTRP